ncbi:MAG: bifunctional phosphopantothenoylcysteine decarboxylase/phosphopantothenate--cysteine ligase CoaBC [Syntrophomonadaceae bacterium]|jgi:phosphopantothenoylcysteine decarboxylase/phosphopantothenate--cysteine ligase|nr:bifunctional phosphopantothenoylcysteine decarboxylase/phosphopantothenate--cysteine ligase CoaBC [Syntrophomonadaceae bacterium]MDH7497609.1 bifunctional phosphopantothenoylcysteine decarboxylase/phosphopantothenate--cysteine ligase CoaBC [Syntrophomonadaceae bacterium]
MEATRTIVVGVTGGIAAYKSAELVSRLRKEGFAVHVIMTRNACRFVAPLTFRTLSGNPVLCDTFEEDGPWAVQHVGVAEAADLLVIAPATANIIAKMAHGLADDLLSTVVLATAAPVLVVPSMNSTMLVSAVVQENLRTLRQRGVTILEPAEGELACGVSGPGRLPEPADIVARIRELLAPAADLAGKTVLITSGPTQEDIDPVRFITNRSSGKMGFALARQALRRGARVLLVSGPTALPAPAGAEVFWVRSARDMCARTLELLPQSDVVIGAAAVADYRPRHVSRQKVKKGDGELHIELERNPDILAEVARCKGARVTVGFAAETEDVLANARVKMEKKKLDLLVANDVTMEGAGFGVDTNVATILSPDGRAESLPRMSKEQLADEILDRVVALL